MILTITRDVFLPDCTLSMWHLDGQFECYGLEDTDRKMEDDLNAKIYGKTAIPRGEYDCIISFSHRFKRDLPLLVSVPGFQGIRIHPGNDKNDTDGCLLPGMSRGEGRVNDSRKAFTRLFTKMLAADEQGQKITVVVK